MSKDSTQNSSNNPIRSKRLQVVIASFVLLVAISIFVIYQVTKTDVILKANGETKEISTHAETVKDVLKEQDITVSKYDKVSPPLNAQIKDDMNIEYKKAAEIVISVDGKQSTVWTTETKVENILKEAKINIAKLDAVSPGLDQEIGKQEEIKINKAFQVTLVDGTKEIKVWSTSTTVANFLKQQGIKLNQLDRVENKLNQQLKSGDKVTIVRVEKVTDVVEESIDFPVEMKKDKSLLKGSEKIVTKGEKGVREKTYEVVKENGKVVSKTLKAEKVVKEPKTQVVAKGTKVITASVSRGSSVKGKKEFYVTSTAYTPSCNGCSGTTATGINLRGNTGLKVIAVDPRVIPLGSKVWVEGYGYAVAGDTGGAIKGNKIDVMFHSSSQAANWGVRRVKIKVLK